MFAILSRATGHLRVLSKVGSTREAEQELCTWYDLAENELSEQAAADMLESLSVVTLH